MTPATEITESSLLIDQFVRVRQQSEALCRPLSPEDMMVQSCPEASPAKWHLAHTTWFFETFLLREFLPGYRDYHADFRWLFNSYYNAVSDQPEKRLRSSFSRPGVEAILAYRRHVEDAMQSLLEAGCNEELLRRVTLGLNHEQQHQELLATDIKHALWSNPLRPSYCDGEDAIIRHARPELVRNVEQSMEWLDYEGGLLEIGSAGEGFAFDNEFPRHPEYFRPFRLASRLVTCEEYLEFMGDGGYQRPELWLAAGWDAVLSEGWRAPLYWNLCDGAWQVYTMRGQIALESLLDTPVCHVSYFEADAFANWKQMRLPTEAEWEIAAREMPVEGNLLETGLFHPQPAGSGSVSESKSDPAQIFGDVWEWTQSPYVGYPGFQPLAGALGEYNGKFMCNQIVLRGGSVVTPATHIRSTYRNFFGPQTRWQFSGIRLAER